MSKLNYLNVGCGDKFHKDWVNVDLKSTSPYVKSHNLFNGIPFPDNQFEVIYHSQVLEHFPKEKASDFILECFRVLKPGGLIRIVVPDLENIVKEYLKFLHENIENPNRQAEENYDWIMLEMYDQTVRNYSGGQMDEFLRQPVLINEEYILKRIGYVGKNIRNEYLSREGKKQKIVNSMKAAKRAGVKRIGQYLLEKIKHQLSTEAKKIRAFRLAGEIHMWMYDRYSLSRLLSKCGFVEIEVKKPHESHIPHWNKYELDVKEGVIFDPTSLFMEAKKPKQ